MNPLVLVHGFMGGSAQWELQRKAFEQHSNVIAVDLPGFGRNNDAPALSSIPDMADWVIAHLDAQGVGQFDLIGHSMGGMIVQQMAHHVPDRIDRLILYSTGAIGVLPGRFETIEESKQRGLDDGIPKTARRIAATWFLNGSAATEYEACATIAQQTAPEAFTGGLDAMQSWSGADHLAAIQAQTLVLWGDGDRTYPWSQIERLWASIPDAQLAVLPNCAHAVHLEKPFLFNQIVLDYLTRR
ncbi:2-hydroxy-6-oxononadienedioate/2-hydroxy-6-oxononatrienedioate hydrolase [Roseobacter fucihabitans]|uniref:2-hydroxy-6-oxononadienedioate/2-hydroxy-6-oxononatrienedioate hydrolase n=1 Tax=Roseobacter fucihabitans TaxID=1537242 RepID=A0ABZ2BRP0_9RHOB|nr:alpha/beta hydrolase [Roseobacter litoralis]MBC6966712.1 2-hydroxy-6-oxononadienedioate/2-hydroxy-6-oxononatrienedioate hydrolase [Roseobacter litoralis]